MRHQRYVYDQTYYMKHREEILAKRRKKEQELLGTSDFGEHVQDSVSKEESAIDSEYQKLGLSKFRRVLHAKSKEEIEAYQSASTG